MNGCNQKQLLPLAVPHHWLYRLRRNYDDKWDTIEYRNTYDRYICSVLLGIHRNQNWKEFLKLSEPCDISGIFFVNVFLTKESFIHFFLNSMHRLKSAILPEIKNYQNGTFEPKHGIQKKYAGRLLLKCYEDEIYKKYS